MNKFRWCLHTAAASIAEAAFLILLWDIIRKGNIILEAHPEPITLSARTTVIWILAFGCVAVSAFVALYDLYKRNDER